MSITAKLILLKACYILISEACHLLKPFARYLQCSSLQFSQALKFIWHNYFKKIAFFCKTNGCETNVLNNEEKIFSVFILIFIHVITKQMRIWMESNSNKDDAFQDSFIIGAHHLFKKKRQQTLFIQISIVC